MKANLHRKNYKDCSGIYLLYYNKTIVYIGMSRVSVLDRIFGNIDSGHIDNKIFNKIEIINMNDKTEKEIQRKEIELIQNHNPYYNIIYRNETVNLTDDILEIQQINRNKQMQLIKQFYESEFFNRL